MKIHVFAILKDYFEEEFELDNISLKSIEQVKNELIRINPAVAPLLKSCRFAIKEEFVSHNFQLQENEDIYILPPSSGG